MFLIVMVLMVFVPFKRNNLIAMKHARSNLLLLFWAVVVLMDIFILYSYITDDQPVAPHRWVFTSVFLLFFSLKFKEELDKRKAT